ncbi:hypothetical protein SADUNF_Sadunf01G0086700 [Salix dunnii]|uniref:rRNA biogenesis protein RRP36 n=1 Tax=Salix dunnii TaxID=1413687 RepID=A0A835TKQ4_9ROSI|nr:hypothetical protein SADUNF_Sadunf01G0086700 [Salix dunnii]
MKKQPSNEFGMSSKTHDVESEELSSSEEDESEIERELAEVTFEDLQKAKSNGSLSVFKKPDQEKKGGRANKNRPTEVSCKKPVTRFREVVQVPKKVVRDPRFESLCGNLDVEGYVSDVFLYVSVNLLSACFKVFLLWLWHYFLQTFRKRYEFLFKNNLPAEKEELKKQLKKSNDPKVIEQLKERVSWIEKQVKFESTKQTDAAEIRKQRLIEKYNKLKASGKLESFIEKRRRKNAAKDHRYMPYRRSTNSEQQS